MEVANLLLLDATEKFEARILLLLEMTRGRYEILSIKEMPKRYHVTPTPDDRWTIKSANASRAIKLFDRKADAIKAAKAAAQRTGANLVVHDRNGRIVSSDTYPAGYGSLKGKYILSKTANSLRGQSRQQTKNQKKR